MADGEAAFEGAEAFGAEAVPQDGLAYEEDLGEAAADAPGCGEAGEAVEEVGGGEVGVIDDDGDVAVGLGLGGLVEGDALDLGAEGGRDLVGGGDAEHAEAADGGKDGGEDGRLAGATGSGEGGIDVAFVEGALESLGGGLLAGVRGRDGEGCGRGGGRLRGCQARHAAGGARRAVEGDLVPGRGGACHGVTDLGAASMHLGGPSVTPGV